MMRADHEMPSWMNRAFGNEEADNMVAWTRVHTDAGQTEWYFTGMLAEMIRMRKLPRNLDIALDMDMALAVVRMEYEEGGDGQDAEGKFRALYTFMDIESFGILWNYRPSSIHGFPDEAVSLHLRDNGVPWPSRIGAIPTNITYDAAKDEFVIELDYLNVDLKELEAA